MPNFDDVRRIKEIKAGENTLYRIREVILDGDTWIDIRKFCKWNDGDWHPMKNGFFCKREVWRKDVLPVIQQMIDDKFDERYELEPLGYGVGQIGKKQQNAGTRETNAV